MVASCAILGDSLAAGVAAVRPDRLADTKIGILSSAYLRAHTAAVDAETVLISLGVDDGDAGPDTDDRLPAALAGLSIFAMGQVRNPAPSGSSRSFN